MTRGAGAAAKNLKIEVVESSTDAAALADEWNDLAVACEAQPFGLPALALPWWEHQGRGELRIVTARYGDGRLAGLAPLFERSQAGLRTTRFLGHGMGAIGGLLSLPSRANIDEALWEAVLADERSTLNLRDFRSRAPGFEALRRSDRWAFHAQLSDECPIVDLTDVSGTDELLADPSKSGVRKKLARARRNVASETVRLTVDRDRTAVAAALDRVLPLYDRAEDLHPRLHFDRDPYRSFFRAAVDALAARNQVVIATLEINGQPAAFDVYVLVGSVAYAILGRYDPSLADHSPGLLLMDRGVQWLADEGIVCIDWQLGADPYKLRWSTDTYDTFNVLAGHPGRTSAAKPILSAIEIAYEMKERMAAWRT